MPRHLSLEERTNLFLEKAYKIHGDLFDYSKINYIAHNIKIEIICKIHGSFYMLPSNHIGTYKQGCSKCYYEKINARCKGNTKNFIKTSNIIHDHKYDYSKTIYGKNNIEKVIITCPIHGDFLQSPYNHISGKGCKKCKSSKGELKIIKWLDINNIEYKIQHIFLDCKNKKHLPFDFYLPDHNTCIEFDGEQHYRPVKWNKNDTKSIERYNNIKINDKIKDEYCLANNIRLIRIPYINYNDINILMESFIIRY